VETIKYVGEARIVIYHNNQKFNQDLYDDDTIETYSKIETKQFRGGDPTFNTAEIHVDEIEDETDYFSVG
jgi:hypothetical protein